MDASVIPYMLESDPSLRNAQDVIDILNKESGVLGVQLLFRSQLIDLSEAVAKGNPKAILAYEMYVDRLKKFIAQYFGVLNGADALIFTAGVGENDTAVRTDVVNGLSWFGMEIDESKNVRGAFGIISKPESKVKVLVVPTNEELVIARDVEAAK